MSNLINTNRGFEAMLPVSEEPKVEEVTIDNTKEVAVEFTIFNWHFKFSITFSRGK